MHVEINWNPKAPAGFQGIYTLDVLTEDSRLVVFYTDSTKGVDACAWFSADGIQIVDNTCHLPFKGDPPSHRHIRWGNLYGTTD